MQFTKADLYRDIEVRKAILSLPSGIGTDVVNWCESRDNIVVKKLPLATVGLRGMVNLSEQPGQPDIIIINSNRAQKEINFICAHELEHSILHRDRKDKLFSCYEDVLPHQDGFIEWQANEGAAEILVPYKSFLPRLRDNYCRDMDSGKIDIMIFRLAEEFNVTESVIEIRLKSLKYEIHQYLSDVDIKDIRILSDSAQKRNGINIPSIIDVRNHKRMVEDFCSTLDFAAPSGIR